MQVVDVQSVARREDGPAAFHEALHAGHDCLLLDLANPNDRDTLRGLLQRADIVIEASRARVLQALGLAAADIATDAGPQAWLRITGHGYDFDRIAFGDDAAVEGGLVAWDERGPMFMGDALADPLTGLLSAVAVLACRADRDHRWIIDVTMAKVARLAAAL